MIVIVASCSYRDVNTAVQMPRLCPGGFCPGGLCPGFRPSIHTDYSSISTHAAPRPPGRQLALRIRKLSYRKDDRAMSHIYGCPEKFGSP